jgi:hypothetical protein
MKLHLIFFAIYHIKKDSYLFGYLSTLINNHLGLRLCIVLQLISLCDLQMTVYKVVYMQGAILLNLVGMKVTSHLLRTKSLS